VRGQRHAPAAFNPRERPGTHCTGGWVGPRAGLDRCGKSRPPPPGFDPRTVQSVRQSLYRLSYSALFYYTEQRLNPLNAELNPICYLLALLGAHHFLHVSRIRVKSLTLRLLMSYIHMEHLFLMFLDHTQRRTTVGRTPLDE